MWLETAFDTMVHFKVFKLNVCLSRLPRFLVILCLLGSSDSPWGNTVEPLNVDTLKSQLLFNQDTCYIPMYISTLKSGHLSNQDTLSRSPKCAFGNSTVTTTMRQQNLLIVVCRKPWSECAH